VRGGKEELNETRFRKKKLLAPSWANELKRTRRKRGVVESGKKTIKNTSEGQNGHQLERKLVRKKGFLETTSINGGEALWDLGREKDTLWSKDS